MACPVCKHPAAEIDGTEQGSTLRCGRCGSVRFAHAPGFVQMIIGRVLESSWRIRAANLSHMLRVGGRAGLAGIDVQELEGWGLDKALPLPHEVIDQLILIVGTAQNNPGSYITFLLEELSARLNLPINVNDRIQPILWLIGQPEVQELIDAMNGPANGYYSFQLKMGGWARFGELQTKVSGVRRAFMAMQFGDEELNDVFSTCFQPAAAAAGFDLRILTEGQPAGSIDDQIRVALRTSRFVVADLTHGNRGAYWEAGFAEGLGRPVIYTCRQDVWAGSEKPHFDTNHLATIIWSADDLHKAARDLTSMIRATLPGEAVMGAN